MGILEEGVTSVSWNSSWGGGGVRTENESYRSHSRREISQLRLSGKSCHSPPH